MNRKFLGLCGVLVLFSGALPVQAESPGTNATPAASALVLAPYLQPLSADSVAVQWETAQPSYGWVEYGETEALGRKQAASVNGLRVANVKGHRVVLGGLCPGRTYYYHVCFKPIRRLTASRVEYEPEQATPIAALHALPGPDQALTVLVFNDLHNDLRTLGALRQGLGDVPFDLSIFNGDCLANLEQEGKALATLAGLTQGVQAGSHPALFIRGNHETRGAFARELPRLLAWPGAKPYFSFTLGPVRFLVLDWGEDKPDDHPEYYGLADFAAYRQEETQWLRQELSSPAFAQAPWHVLVHHIPLRATGAQSGPDSWERLLAAAHIDLALNAHLHAAAFHPADTVGVPYPIVVGGGPRPQEATVMVLQADSRRLKLRVLEARGHTVLPVFEKRKE